MGAFVSLSVLAGSEFIHIPPSVYGQPHCPPCHEQGLRSRAQSILGFFPSSRPVASTWR